MINPSFAVRLKELRIEKGLTQQQLADILKVDRTTVMKWARVKEKPILQC